MTNKDNPEDKTLSKEDRDLWSIMTKGVKRLSQNKSHSATSTSSPDTEAQKGKNRHRKDQKRHSSTTSTPYRSHTVKENAPPAKATDLDGKTEERLRKGRLPIEATIDLHGMRQHEAQDALIAFIKRTHRQGKRCVMVITGKGSLSAPGVLKQKTPVWLAESPLREIVLKTYPAQRKHGGSGALYVYLRRNRA